MALAPPNSSGEGTAEAVPPNYGAKGPLFLSTSSETPGHGGSCARWARFLRQRRRKRVAEEEGLLRCTFGIVRASEGTTLFENLPLLVPGKCTISRLLVHHWRTRGPFDSALRIQQSPGGLLRNQLGLLYGRPEAASGDGTDADAGPADHQADPSSPRSDLELEPLVVPFGVAGESDSFHKAYQGYARLSDMPTLSPTHNTRVLQGRTD